MKDEHFHHGETHAAFKTAQRAAGQTPASGRKPMALGSQKVNAASARLADTERQTGNQ